MKRVVVFGAFDPIHKGHEYFFRQAKALGDILIAIVASDEKIKLLKHHKPRQDEITRLLNVKKCSYVDEVILGDKNDKFTILDTVKPDIIAVGYDQQIPGLLKIDIKEYELVRLAAFKPERYKSSIIWKRYKK